MAARNKRGRNQSSQQGSAAPLAAGVEIPKNLASRARTSSSVFSRTKDALLFDKKRRFEPTTIDALRRTADVHEIIKRLINEEGLFSSAANSAVSIAASAGFRLAGYTAAGEMDLAVMRTAWSFIDTLDTRNDYRGGYNDGQSTNSLYTSLLLDTVSSGGLGAELVLDKDLRPHRVVTFPYSSIVWKSRGDGHGKYPAQRSNQNLDIDVPTVFIAEHNLHPDDSYAVSMLRPGIENAIGYTELLQDTRRALRRSGHNRITVSIDAEKLESSAPEDIRKDPVKLRDYIADQKNQIDNMLMGAEPEDAFVHFDCVSFLVHDSDGSKADYAPLLKQQGNIVGASLKTPASVTGLRAEGGQALSNAETLVYLKTVEALPQTVCGVLSRILTLCVRLVGIDGYIKVDPKPIDLRPKNELEAYYATRQNRFLQLNSLGLISDARLCYELDIRPTELHRKFSGTGYYDKVGSNSANSNQEAERESSSGRALNPGTPSKSGGKDQ